MIQVFIRILFGLGLSVSVLSGYFEWSERKTPKFLTVAGLTFISLIMFILQETKQKADSDEINRINEELLGHTTGGTDNKPLVTVEFDFKPDGSCKSYFKLTNEGKYPLSNMYCVVIDYATALDCYAKSVEPYADTIPVICDSTVFKDYTAKNINQVRYTENVSSLPENTWRLVHTGNVDWRVHELSYHVTLTWNNESYSILYRYFRRAPGTYFTLKAVSIKDKLGRYVKDYKAFFSIAPGSFSDGISDKIDTSAIDDDVLCFPAHTISAFNRVRRFKTVM